MYKYELHLHTLGCSKCAGASIEEMVLAVKEKGYKGFVVTDHFHRGNTCVDRNLPWEQFVAAYEENWLRGKAFGEQHGIDVIFGIEDHYFYNAKEVLIYGITPEELKAEPKFITFGIEQMFDFVNAHGGFISHAHPFRDRSYIKEPDSEPNPKALHGVEVFNAHDPEDRNQKALEFAKRNGLKLLSGGDVHLTNDRLGTAGIAVDQPITDTKELAKVLHSGNYKVIINGEPL